MTGLKDRLNAAMQLQLSQNYDEAGRLYEEILVDHSDQPDAVHLLGLVRMEQNRDEEALYLMEKALTLYPQAAHFHHNIAGLYRRLGQLDKAEAGFRQAIELKPDYGEAYQGLGEMIRFTVDDPLKKNIMEQIAREDLEDVVKSYFHFAAGKFFDDTNQPKKAFPHYHLGNQLAGRKFDPGGFRDFIKATLYVYSDGFIRRLGQAGLDTEIPTFIVGMPRSGTTLIEQILASHSQVYGAGELNELKSIATNTKHNSAFKSDYPNSIPGLSTEHYKPMAQHYLSHLLEVAGSREYARIIDKHPLNFQFIGLIYSMFPKAKIIHTVRNPLDTVLSCYFQNFTKGQDYSFDLTNLGCFYNDYRRLMEHWQMLYPGRILTVRYEDVIADQEGETRRMLEYLGLPFDQDCLEFHKTERKVSTASFLQVRQPIYGSSQARWKKYRTELSEIAKIIGIRIDSPVTITGSAGL